MNPTKFTLWIRTYIVTVGCFLCVLVLICVAVIHLLDVASHPLGSQRSGLVGSHVASVKG